MEGILRAWWTILAGNQPCLSIEVTRECPLSCPGCYAYSPDHLDSRATLQTLTDYRGDDLVRRVLALVRRERPLHVSVVGGEPLVRYRELGQILPELDRLGVHTHVVTSAVRPIPPEWARLRRLKVIVSIDGLQPEHDARRKPATYDRILRHISGHGITVHCTVTRQQAQRVGYLDEFVRWWSDVPEAREIWVSLYTPQVGELSNERLGPAERAQVIAELSALYPRYPKLSVGRETLAALAAPPQSPNECIFALVTRCVSADLHQPVTPCQLGGHPDCSNCGCMASAGLTAVGRHRLPGGLPVGRIFDWSRRVGTVVRRLRQVDDVPHPATPATEPSRGRAG
jgi:sulfatase maturation enzyme AslB (radical SAM superfamily)